MTTPKSEDILSTLTQQEFLRASAKDLEIAQSGLAKRMHVPWDTFRRWLLPSESEGHREMPEMAWAFVREIQAYERLKRSK